jgi:hypothetical protein
MTMKEVNEKLDQLLFVIRDGTPKLITRIIKTNEGVGFQGHELTDESSAYISKILSDYSSKTFIVEPHDFVESFLPMPEPNDIEG